MVIVSSILERENEDHGETLWNTAGLLMNSNMIKMFILKLEIFLLSGHLK